MRITVTLFLLFAGLISKSQYSIRITATEQDYHQVTLTVKLPRAIDMKNQYRLVNQQNGQSIDAQLKDEETIVFIPPHIKANSNETWKLEKLGKKKNTNVKFKEWEKGILASVGGRPLFFYNTATVMPPADSPAYYQRSGFIHPLYSPDGEILTDDFPAGHAHQHALFAAWTNTTFKKTFVDFWNQHSRKGTVEHIKVISKQDGVVFGKLEVLLRYKSLEFGEVLQEKWSITIYPFTEYFLFDIESIQTNTSQDTLYINKYHYGGMGLRGSKYWNPDDRKNFRNSWKLITNEGIKDSAANHTHVKWVAVSGRVEKLEAGVAVFDHPSNFRYPQAIRVHPSMPYFVFAPMVDGAFTINPGETYKSSFRYYVHSGKADVNRLNEVEKSYSSPPAVEVVAGE